MFSNLSKTIDSCPGTCRAHMTLTFGLPEQMFPMAHLLMMENNCANLYWNPSKIVGVMVPTKIWSSSVTLTLGLPEQIFQIAHLHVMVNNCVKLFWNPSTIVEVMVQINTCMHEDTHAHTPNCVFVTTISRSPQACSTINHHFSNIRVVVCKCFFSLDKSIISSFVEQFNPFPNGKFWTLPNWKSLQTPILNLMKMAESYLIG